MGSNLVKTLNEVCSKSRINFEIALKIISMVMKMTQNVYNSCKNHFSNYCKLFKMLK